MKTICIWGLTWALAMLPPCSALAKNSEVLWNADNGKDGWEYYGGWEFPGAKGAVQATADGDENVLRLDGDFTGGGSYVAVRKKLSNALNLDQLDFSIKSENVGMIVIRIKDFAGQVHSKNINIKANNEWQDISVEINEKNLSKHFGGPNDGKWYYSVKGISILLPGWKLKKDKIGSLLLKNIKGQLSAKSPSFRSGVSVSLGEKLKVNGLAARGGDKGKIHAGTQGGKDCYGTNIDQQLYYLYFDIEDSYLYDTKDRSIKIKIEYLDEGDGSFSLQYDSHKATSEEAETVKLGHTGRWKTKTITVRNAKFANRCNGDDFRLSIWHKGGPAANLYVSSVSVKK